MTTCGVVLAAGWGTRLRPLAADRPKASFPIGRSSLLLRAIETLRPFTDEIAVNYCGFADWFRECIPPGVRHFEEAPEPLGTAGALLNMRSWIDDRDVAALNADSVFFGDVGTFVRQVRDRPSRLLVSFDRSRPDFHDVWRFAGLSTMTRESLRQLPHAAEDLYHDLWKQQLARGDAVLVPFAGGSIDCGTPRDLLVANLVETTGRSVVEDGAIVHGTVESSVVLRGGKVRGGDAVVNRIVGPGGVFGLD